MKNKFFLLLLIIVLIFVGWSALKEAQAGILDDIWSVITQGFSAIFKPVLGLIANHLPTTESDSLPFKNAIEQVLTIGYKFSFVIPWGTLFLCVWVMLGIELSVVALKITMWIIRLARG